MGNVELGRVRCRYGTFPVSRGRAVCTKFLCAPHFVDEMSMLGSTMVVCAPGARHHKYRLLSLEMSLKYVGGVFAVSAVLAAESPGIACLHALSARGLGCTPWVEEVSAEGRRPTAGWLKYKNLGPSLLPSEGA